MPCFTEVLGRDASVHLVPSEHPFQLGMQTLVTPKWNCCRPQPLLPFTESAALCWGASCLRVLLFKPRFRDHSLVPLSQTQPALTPAGISGPQCHPGIKTTALGSRVQTELGILFDLWMLFSFLFCVVVCLRQFQSILCKEKYVCIKKIHRNGATKRPCVPCPIPALR